MKSSRSVVNTKKKNLPRLFLFLMLILACDKPEEKDNIILPKVTIEDLTLTKAGQDTTIQVRILLDQPALTNVIVRVSTRSGTAIGGVNFTEISDQSLVIETGKSELLLPIVIRRTPFEQPARTFEIVLLNVINATLERNSATITIRNNQIGPGAIDVPTGGANSPESYDGYNLVWSDEFKESEIDESKWSFEIGRGNSGWGNNELQYYRRENSFIHDNEFLIIEARQESFGGASYTSSRMITSEKASFKYGRIDIRAALPKTQGLWPALWMLGDSFWTRGWPACGEIDIMEMLGHQSDKVYGTAHWGPNFSQRRLKEGSIFALPGPDFHDQFHVFSIIWEEDKIEWYVDNRRYNTLTPEDMGGLEYPFNESFFFIFNVAVGGNWPGSPNQSTVLPQRMIVDYIRVFQKE